MLSIALEAQRYHDDDLALEIAGKFKSAWLDKQDPTLVLSSKDVLNFFPAFYSLVMAKDQLTGYMYHFPSKSDSAMGAKGYSTRLTDYVITKDFIEKEIKTNGKYNDKNPDWNRMETKIKDSYDKGTAARLILNSKIGWYEYKQDWRNAVKYNILKIDAAIMDTSKLDKGMINNVVFDIILQHSDDTFALKKGLVYMELILKNNPDRDSWIDTYASLLYKTGKWGEAIKHEHNAILLAEKRKDLRNVKIYRETLKKMEEKLPLW